MSKSKPLIAQVVLPIAIPRPYSYKVPKELEAQVKFGMRVEVPLKQRLLSGILVSLEGEELPNQKLKYIESVIDKEPIIDENQYMFWKWIADYYASTLGEVMNAALPGGLKLVSETRVVSNSSIDPYDLELTDDEFMIAEAVNIQGEIKIADIQDILQKKSVYPVIMSLIDKRAIVIKEELIEKFKPRLETFVNFPQEIIDNPELIEGLFEKVQRSELQRKALLAYIQFTGGKKEILRKTIMDKAEVSSAVIKSMEKKGIFILEKKQVSRLGSDYDVQTAKILSPLQIEKVAEIKANFLTYTTTLLHGVTGSGKTRIYTELIAEVLAKDKQALYLLPEIALTTQIVERLKEVFGDQVLVYHSKLNSHERVELYKEAMKPGKVILGPRSAIFLPFKNLELIIVDEEHDPSYKQQNPAPRYNARDIASVLAHIHGAKVLLGTATPSLESWEHAHNGKYGFVELKERFGPSILPKIELIDLKRMHKTKRMKSYFSLAMLQAIEDELVMKRQVILFQNRRGFAPVQQCELCGWVAGCRNCDTSMTMHKYFEELRCHYCGSRQALPKSCPDCGNEHITLSGFGTEKIEEELKALLPNAKIGRMDYDTANTKNAFERIIHDFTNHHYDILIGTQMVTKGLDFGNVSLVGILNADKLLSFPDFRSNERAFQLMLQVSGRAGRRETQGRVMIQTFTPGHPVFSDVINQDFDNFYTREKTERELHGFPPNNRIMQLTIKHKKVDVTREGAEVLGGLLRKQLGARVSNVFEPSISRLRNYYIRHIIIKMEKSAQANREVKKWVNFFKGKIQSSDGFKSLRVNVDVDPY